MFPKSKIARIVRHIPVVTQMILSPESLATHVTWVRSLVRMSALVDQQIVGLCKMAAAEATDELLPSSARVDRC